jgi:hypothetical protein
MTFHRDQRVEQVDNAAKERSPLQDFFVSIGVRVLTFGGLFVGDSSYPRDLLPKSSAGST